MAKIKNNNLLGVGFYKGAYSICDALIKTYGAIFIYNISKSFTYVLYYIIIYSAVQILAEISLVKLFSKYAKLSLILRVIPFLMMYGVFFFNTTAEIYLMIIAISNGLINAFGACPLDRINGEIKKANNPKYQSIIMAIHYLGKAIVVVISGFLLDGIETKYVSLIGIIIYIISTIVFAIFYKQDKKQIIDEEKIIKVNDVKKSKFNPFKNYYPALAEALIGIYPIMEVLWGTYVYIELGSFAMLGIVKSVIAIASFCGCLLVNFVSRKNNWKYFALGGLMLLVVCWIISPFMLSIAGFVVLSLIKGFCEPLYITPMSSTYYKVVSTKVNAYDQLTLKDFYRKSLSIPVSAICIAIASPAYCIVFVGVVMGLAGVQILPAASVDKRYSELNENKTSEEKDDSK